MKQKHCGGQTVLQAEPQPVNSHSHLSFLGRPGEYLKGFSWRPGTRSLILLSGITKACLLYRARRNIICCLIYSYWNTSSSLHKIPNRTVSLVETGNLKLGNAFTSYYFSQFLISSFKFHYLAVIRISILSFAYRCDFGGTAAPP